MIFLAWCTEPPDSTIEVPARNDTEPADAPLKYTHFKTFNISLLCIPYYFLLNAVGGS